MAMTRRFCEVLIQQKGWRPIMENGGWIDFKRNRAGTYITFEGHTLRYKCTYTVARELIEMGGK